MNTTSQPPHPQSPLMKKQVLMSNIFEQEFEVEGFSLGMFDLFGRQVVPRKIRWAGEGGGLGGGGQVRAIIPCQATHCLPPSPGASLYIPLPHSCTSMYHHLAPPCTSPVPIIPCQATHSLSVPGSPNPRGPNLHS